MRCLHFPTGRFVVGLALFGALATSALAAPKKDFKFAWSIYVGWMPWGWAASSSSTNRSARSIPASGPTSTP